MKHIIRPLIFATIIITGITAYSEKFTYKANSFTALVRNVRLQTPLIEQGKKTSNKVTVVAPSVIFDDPVVISDVRTVSKSYGDEIDTLIAYIKANIEGSREEILSFWHPSERARIEEFLNDPDLSKKNREAILNNPGLTIIGLIKQENTISILQKRSFVYAVTLKQSDGKLQLVNNPDDDLELSIIEASFYSDP